VSHMTEPTITINGHELTPAQAVAVRVAVTNFHAAVSDTRPRRQRPLDRHYAALLGKVLRIMLPS
jgi:hypothetical protein